MHEKVYFSFFMLCAVFFQGILAKLIEEDVMESSNLLIREKRVIDRSGEETPLKNGDAPYVVNLKKNNRLHCIATILSPYTVITAAQCVILEVWLYSVYSGSAYSQYGIEHNVTEKKEHTSNPSRTIVSTTGIALLTVNPPFVFTRSVGNIRLYTGPIMAGTPATISGWGTHIYSGHVETAFVKRLRSITVPIVNHQECVNIYRGYFPILEEDICAYDPLKLCGETDAGAPLVINGQLVGVFIGRLPTLVTEHHVRPDVFVLLQHHHYGPWIVRNVVH